MLSLLAKLVSIRSLSGKEGEAAGMVAAVAAGLGVSVRRHFNNVWFEIGQGEPRLLINSHIDTVPPCGGWNGDPWTPAIKDGRLTGLGANDAKGSVAAILLAAELLKKEGLGGTGTLVVAITAEEETGGPNGITSVLPLLGRLDAAVIGEPTGLAPCTAQSGMLLLRCTAKGDAGHAAHAGQLGLRNAIHAAARDIAALAAMRFEPYNGMPAAAPQVTRVSGGTSHNQVPEICEFDVDIRTTPNLNHAALTELIERTLESDVHCLSDRYVPVSTAPGEPIVLAAVSASGKAPLYSITCSDWSLIGPMPAVKIGPGESDRSHRPNEYLLASELESAVGVYCVTVRNYFAEYKNAR